jgi:hypothetical protein
VNGMSRRSRVRRGAKPRVPSPSSGNVGRRRRGSRCRRRHCRWRRPGGSRWLRARVAAVARAVDHARVRSGHRPRTSAAPARLPAAPPPCCAFVPPGAAARCGGRLGWRLPSRGGPSGRGPRSRRGSPWARRGSRSPRGTVEPADALFARTVVRGTLLRWGRSFTRALFARGALRTAGGGGFGSDGFGARPSRWNGGTMGGARELVELCRGDGRRP